MRPREVGREDPPHCATRRAERTQRLQALLPPEARADRVAKRALRALYSQLLWDAYWLRCPWIWVGDEARELLGSYHQLGAPLLPLPAAPVRASSCRLTRACGWILCVWQTGGGATAGSRSPGHKARPGGDGRRSGATWRGVGRHRSLATGGGSGTWRGSRST